MSRGDAGSGIGVSFTLRLLDLLQCGENLRRSFAGGNKGQDMIKNSVRDVAHLEPVLDGHGLELATNSEADVHLQANELVILSHDLKHTSALVGCKDCSALLLIPVYTALLVAASVLPLLPVLTLLNSVSNIAFTDTHGRRITPFWEPLMPASLHAGGVDDAPPCTCGDADEVLPARSHSRVSQVHRMSKPTTVESRRLRATLLAASRVIYGGGEVWTGRISVTITAPGTGYEVTVRPVQGLDGLNGEEGHAVSVAETALKVEVDRLRAHLLSPDEQKLLVALAEAEPCTAGAVQEKCKAVLGKSDFWAAWGQLQKRRLVEQGDDDKYRVGQDWIRPLLR